MPASVSLEGGDLQVCFLKCSCRKGFISCWRFPSINTAKPMKPCLILHYVPFLRFVGSWFYVEKYFNILRKWYRWQMMNFLSDFKIKEGAEKKVCLMQCTQVVSVCTCKPECTWARTPAGEQNWPLCQKIETANGGDASQSGRYWVIQIYPLATGNMKLRQW